MLSALPYGLPNGRKHFHFQDLFLHVRRQFHITYVAKCRLFILQLLIYIANSLFLSTVFRSDMVHPSGCYSKGNETSGETGSSCQLQIAQNSLITENINFLSVTISITSFCAVSTSAAFFLPMAKIFLNEHQNSKDICLLCIILISKLIKFFLAYHRMLQSWRLFPLYHIHLYLRALYSGLDHFSIFLLLLWSGPR